MAGMSRRRWLATAALAIAGACSGGGDDDDVNDVASEDTIIEEARALVASVTGLFAAPAEERLVGIEECRDPELSYASVWSVVDLGRPPQAADLEAGRDERAGGTEREWVRTSSDEAFEAFAPNDRPELELAATSRCIRVDTEQA
jgi:hypothetical protein